MCPSQIACQSANTDPPVPPKDRPLPDISATAIIGRCTWAEVEWSVVVEFGVAAVALCAALPASPVRKIAGSRMDSEGRLPLQLCVAFEIGG